MKPVLAICNDRLREQQKESSKCEYFVEMPDEEEEVAKESSIHLDDMEESVLSVSMVAGMSLRKRRTDEENFNYDKGQGHADGKKQKRFTTGPNEDGQNINTNVFGEFCMSYYSI